MNLLKLLPAILIVGVFLFFDSSACKEACHVGG
jgi:hypothetical protein